MTQAAMPMPALRRDVNEPYASVLERLPQKLKDEGFGVLTEIDVKTTFNEKIGVDFRRYKILGACNPALAHRALSSDLAVGVLLPCNVVVYEIEENKTAVLAMDPVGAMGIFGGDELKAVAAEVSERLGRVLEGL